MRKKKAVGNANVPMNDRSWIIPCKSILLLNRMNNSCIYHYYHGTVNCDLLAIGECKNTARIYIHHFYPEPKVKNEEKMLGF